MDEQKKTYKIPEASSENKVVDYAFETMLKSFLHKVEKDGVLKEVKARRYYIKKSELKRLAKKEHKRK